MFKKDFNIYKNGTKDVLVIAGIHGNELTSIYAVMEFEKALEKYILINNPEIRKVTIINFANQEAINTAQRNYNFFDLNKDFSIEMKPVNKITVEIVEEIKTHDIIICVHTYGLKHLVKDIVSINNNAQAKTYVDFCNKYQIPFALNKYYQNSIKQYAIDLGKVAFTLELAGGLGKISKANVASCYNQLFRIINFFKLDDFPSSNEKYHEDYCLEDLKATNTGIFIDNEIIDANSKVLSSYRPFEKNIIFTTTNDFVCRDDYILSVQPNII
jgi:predicted deacylase